MLSPERTPQRCVVSLTSSLLILCFTASSPLARADGLNKPQAGGATTPALGDVSMDRQREFLLFVQGDGRPLAGAEVDFGNGNTARTDQAGTASFSMHFRDDAAFVHLAFTVRATGFAGAGWSGGLPVGTTTQVITLVRETPLTGRILDARGRPVANAVLSARAAEAWLGVGVHTNASTPPDETVGTARTDAAGAFSLHGMRDGDRYRVTITPADRAVGVVERIVTAGRVPIDIALVTAAPVTLNISGLTRGPLLADLQPGQAGPGLSLEWLDPSTGNWQRVISPRQITWNDNARADLRFEQVPAGSVRVVVQGDYTIASDLFEPFEVVGATPSSMPVELTENRQVGIQITDAQGRPVSGARVEVSGYTGRSSSYTNTSADGLAVFRVHPSHDSTATVTIAGMVTATAVVSANSGDLIPIVVVAR